MQQKRQCKQSGQNFTMLMCLLLLLLATMQTATTHSWWAQHCSEQICRRHQQGNKKQQQKAAAHESLVNSFGNPAANKHRHLQTSCQPNICNSMKRRRRLINDVHNCKNCNKTPLLPAQFQNIRALGHHAPKHNAAAILLKRGCFLSLLLLLLPLLTLLDFLLLWLLPAAMTALLLNLVRLLQLVACAGNCCEMLSTGVSGAAAAALLAGRALVPLPPPPPPPAACFALSLHKTPPPLLLLRLRTCDCFTGSGSTANAWISGKPNGVMVRAIVTMCCDPPDCDVLQLPATGACNASGFAGFAKLP